MSKWEEQLGDYLKQISKNIDQGSWFTSEWFHIPLQEAMIIEDIKRDHGFLIHIRDSLYEIRTFGLFLESHPYLLQKITYYSSQDYSFIQTPHTHEREIVARINNINHNVIIHIPEDLSIERIKPIPKMKEGKITLVHVNKEEGRALLIPPKIPREFQEDVYLNFEEVTQRMQEIYMKYKDYDLIPSDIAKELIEYYSYFKKDVRGIFENTEDEYFVLMQSIKIEKIDYYSNLISMLKICMKKMEKLAPYHAEGFWLHSISLNAKGKEKAIINNLTDFGILTEIDYDGSLIIIYNSYQFSMYFKYVLLYLNVLNIGDRIFKSQHHFINENVRIEIDYKQKKFLLLIKNLPDSSYVKNRIKDKWKLEIKSI